MPESIGVIFLNMNDAVEVGDVMIGLYSVVGKQRPSIDNEQC